MDPSIVASITAIKAAARDIIKLRRTLGRSESARDKALEAIRTIHEIESEARKEFQLIWYLSDLCIKGLNNLATTIVKIEELNEKMKTDYTPEHMDKYHEALEHYNGNSIVNWDRNYLVKNLLPPKGQTQTEYRTSDNLDAELEALGIKDLGAGEKNIILALKRLSKAIENLSLDDARARREFKVLEEWMGKIETIKESETGTVKEIYRNAFAMLRGLHSVESAVKKLEVARNLIRPAQKIHARLEGTPEYKLNGATMRFEAV